MCLLRLHPEEHQERTPDLPGQYRPGRQQLTPDHRQNTSAGNKQKKLRIRESCLNHRHESLYGTKDHIAVSCRQEDTVHSRTGGKGHASSRIAFHNVLSRRTSADCMQVHVAPPRLCSYSHTRTASAYYITCTACALSGMQCRKS